MSTADAVNNTDAFTWHGQANTSAVTSASWHEAPNQALHTFMMPGAATEAAYEQEQIPMNIGQPIVALVPGKHQTGSGSVQPLSLQPRTALRQASLPLQLPGKNVVVTSESEDVARFATQTRANALDPAQLDPEKARRIVANRQSAHKSRQKKQMYLHGLAETAQNIAQEAMVVSASAEQLLAVRQEKLQQAEALRHQLATLTSQVNAAELHHDALKSVRQQIKAYTDQLLAEKRAAKVLTGAGNSVRQPTSSNTTAAATSSGQQSLKTSSQGTARAASSGNGHTHASVGEQLASTPSSRGASQATQHPEYSSPASSPVLEAMSKPGTSRDSAPSRMPGGSADAFGNLGVSRLIHAVNGPSSSPLVIPPPTHIQQRSNVHSPVTRTASVSSQAHSLAHAYHEGSPDVHGQPLPSTPHSLAVNNHKPGPSSQPINGMPASPFQPAILTGPMHCHKRSANGSGSQNSGMASAGLQADLPQRTGSNNISRYDGQAAGAGTSQVPQQQHLQGSHQGGTYDWQKDAQAMIYGHMTTPASMPTTAELLIDGNGSQHTPCSATNPWGLPPGNHIIRQESGVQGLQSPDHVAGSAPDQTISPVMQAQKSSLKAAVVRSAHTLASDLPSSEKRHRKNNPNSNGGATPLLQRTMSEMQGSGVLAPHNTPVTRAGSQQLIGTLNAAPLSHGNTSHNTWTLPNAQGPLSGTATPSLLQLGVPWNSTDQTGPTQQPLLPANVPSGSPLLPSLSQYAQTNTMLDQTGGSERLGHTSVLGSSPDSIGKGNSLLFNMMPMSGDAPSSISAPPGLGINSSLLGNMSAWNTLPMLGGPLQQGGMLDPRQFLAPADDPVDNGVPWAKQNSRAAGYPAGSSLAGHRSPDNQRLNSPGPRLSSLGRGLMQDVASPIRGSSPTDMLNLHDVLLDGSPPEGVILGDSPTTQRDLLTNPSSLLEPSHHANSTIPAPFNRPSGMFGNMSWLLDVGHVPGTADLAASSLAIMSNSTTPLGTSPPDIVPQTLPQFEANVDMLTKGFARLSHEQNNEGSLGSSPVNRQHNQQGQQSNVMNGTQPTNMNTLALQTQQVTDNNTISIHNKPMTASSGGHPLQQQCAGIVSNQAYSHQHGLVQQGLAPPSLTRLSLQDCEMDQMLGDGSMEEV